jgi:hypothetical protein
VPAEVLVMCDSCGRPQTAARRRCAFCNAELPEAPLPPLAASAPPPPRPGLAPVSLDLGNRRALSVDAVKLSFQGRPGGGAPLDVPWARVRRLEWRTRPYLEALGLLAFTALGFFAPANPVRVMAFAAGVMGLLLMVLYRHHGLTVELEDGTRMQWPLGMAPKGSAREARLTSAWSALRDAARARGVTLSGPGA